VKFDKDYYENGVQLGISGYSNYRWLPDLTIPMCKKIVDYLEIAPHHRILDFGCAKGYIVKGFDKLNYHCVGVDISEYAIAHCDTAIKDKVGLYKGEETCFFKDGKKFDFVIAKDVFEHIPVHSLTEILGILHDVSKKILCIVPLGRDGRYIIPEYEYDITHIIREDITWWKNLFCKNDFKIESASYRVPGIKDNWAHYPKGNAFIVASTLPCRCPRAGCKCC
jgi:SAM-dependent methyltransferase